MCNQHMLGCYLDTTDMTFPKSKWSLWWMHINETNKFQNLYRDNFESPKCENMNMQAWIQPHEVPNLNVVCEPIPQKEIIDKIQEPLTSISSFGILHYHHRTQLVQWHAINGLFFTTTSWAKTYNDPTSRLTQGKSISGQSGTSDIQNSLQWPNNYVTNFKNDVFTYIPKELQTTHCSKVNKDVYP